MPKPDFTKAQQEEIKREREYWEGRVTQLVEQMEADEARLGKKLAKAYDRMLAELKREIAAYYQEYGTDGVIEYRRLLASLSDEDRELLMQKMNEFALKYPEYADLLPIRESIYKLDRLEGLQYSVWVQQLEIGAIEQAAFEAHLAKYAALAANLAAEQLGFGKNFYRVNDALIRAVIGERWSNGDNFSGRIWANTEKLANTLNTELAQMFARGVKYDEMARYILEMTRNPDKKKGLKDAMRLIYTEGTFVFNEAQARVHEQNHGYYRMVTITEGLKADKAARFKASPVCDVCRKVSEYQVEEPVAFSDRQPGVNFPPMHPRCRCSYIVVEPDWDDWIERYVAEHGGDYIQRRDRPDLNSL